LLIERGKYCEKLAANGHRLPGCGVVVKGKSSSCGADRQDSLVR
jgi:hypothetical protein